MIITDGRTDTNATKETINSNFARSAVFLEGEPPRLPPAQVGTGGAKILLRPMERTVASGSEGDGAGLNSVPT